MDNKTLSDIQREALKRYPEEMVGYIKKGVFYPLKNVSQAPTKRYKLSISDQFEVLDNKDVEYLVHSHTVMDNTPSILDLQSQKSSGIPFLIIGTDGNFTTNIKEIR